MKIGILCMVGLLVVAGAQRFTQIQDAGEKAHQQWLEARYKEATSIRPGMTRADLLKLFGQEGGIQTPTSQRYVLKSCSLIHIDVKFDKYDAANRQRDDSVRIEEVSRPYLDRIVLD